MTSIAVLVQNPYDGDVRVRRKAEALVSAGYAVDVYALRGARRERRYTLDGVSVHTLGLGKRRGTLLRYAFEYAAFFVWAFLRVSLRGPGRGYALVEANTLPDFLVFAGALARTRGSRLLLDMHEITPEFYVSKYRLSGRASSVRALRWIERASMRFADRVVTVNEPIQDLLVSRGLPREKSTVITNSADERLVSCRRETPPPPRTPGTFVLMYHGTITETYGLDVAIAALARARADLPGAELWMLGNGPERARLEQLARAHDVASAVRFFPPVAVSEVSGWLEQCDIGILPMRRDVFLDLAFPNKLSEFVVAGKTAVVPRLRAIRHYFSDAALAFFEPGDAGDLARQIVRLGREPALRASLAARARVEYRPIRWDVMRARYLALVADLVAEPACARDSVVSRDGADSDERAMDQSGIRS